MSCVSWNRLQDDRMTHPVTVSVNHTVYRLPAMPCRHMTNMPLGSCRMTSALLTLHYSPVSLSPKFARASSVWSRWGHHFATVLKSLAQRGLHHLFQAQRKPSFPVSGLSGSRSKKKQGGCVFSSQSLGASISSSWS